MLNKIFYLTIWILCEISLASAETIEYRKPTQAVVYKIKSLCGVKVTYADKTKLIFTFLNTNRIKVFIETSNYTYLPNLSEYVIVRIHGRNDELTYFRVFHLINKVDQVEFEADNNLIIAAADGIKFSVTRASGVSYIFNIANAGLPGAFHTARTCQIMG